MPAVVAGAMQVLSDNMAAAMEALHDKLFDKLSEMFCERVDLSSVSQSTVTDLLQSLGIQITVLSLEAAIQVTRSWCSIALVVAHVLLRLAHGC